MVCLLYVSVFYNRVKYANDLVLLAKEEAVLHSLIERPLGIGRWRAMDMNVAESNAIRM